MAPVPVLANQFYGNVQDAMQGMHNIGKILKPSNGTAELPSGEALTMGNLPFFCSNAHEMSKYIRKL